jgi:hypothetical protein
MPSLIDIIIRGADRSGPAFASAGANLARLTQAAGPAQTSIRQLGVATSAAGTQAATGLARIETQAEGSASAIITLGIAGSTTATRMRSLTVSILNQEQRLDILAQVLRETAAGHDADSVAVRRAQLAYDSLNRTLANNRARMQDLRQSGDVSGISVVGGGGGAAAAGLGGALGGLRGAAGALGIAFGAQEIVQFGVAAIGAANDLEQVDATVQALSRTQERYNQVLALSRHNQDLYGGSQQQNLEALSALIPLVATYNLNLQQVDKNTRLLAASNRDQGTAGAAFAIREFLTGTGAEGVTSLADRFNLIKAPLTDILHSTDDLNERNRLLGIELARQGITEQLLTNQVNSRAAAYDRLGGAATNARSAVGGMLADQLQPYAEALTGLFQIISGDASGAGTSFGRAGRTFMEPFNRTPPMMRAAGAQTGQPVVVNNYTIQGSLVTERQIAETTRRNLSQTAARNGMSSRR